VRPLNSCREWLNIAMPEPTFAAMKALLLASMGERLVPGERDVFTALTQRPEPPEKRVEELWIIAGRRSGKTRAIAALAVWLSALCDWRHLLSPGERGVLPIMAASTQQARQCFNYIRNLFEGSDTLWPLVVNMTSDTISLKSRIDIQVRPASFRSIRGITAIAAIAEEASMWMPEDFGSKNPDKEILAAVRPCLATTNGTLFVIGSPHARRGETWRMFKKHFGVHGDRAILVANGATKSFNPTIAQSLIDRAYEEDPVIAASEWGGEFRNDLEGYASFEAIESCVEHGVSIRERQEERVYHAHVDPSGSGADSFTCAIGHLAEGTAIIDVLLEQRPPFSPEETVGRFCEVLKSYRVYKVVGDAYSGEFVRELFNRQGITYELSDRSTSDYFSAFAPILNSRRVTLPDNRRMVLQFAALERRASRIGAKDSIGHPSGGHDDLATVVAGLAARLCGHSEPGILGYYRALAEASEGERVFDVGPFPQEPIVRMPINESSLYR
jgi:hypothetical protein